LVGNNVVNHFLIATNAFLFVVTGSLFVEVVGFVVVVNQSAAKSNIISTNFCNIYFFQNIGTHFIVIAYFYCTRGYSLCCNIGTTQIYR
jgi:hypothetical protein